MSGFEPVFTGDHLRAALCPGTRPALVVTFDFRRVTRQGFSEPNNSSSFARQGYAQLSVTCRVNDWFINSETEALESALAAVAARYDRVHSLGYSMGGYGAFRFARALRLTSVVAISPQATLAPGAVPFDTRYRVEARNFDAALGDLAPRGRADLPGLLLVDPFVPEDLAHARLIQSAFPATRIIRLCLGGHPSWRLLRDSGKGWLVQRETIALSPSGAAIRDAHRAARRASPLYWGRLADLAGTRRPALAAVARTRADETFHEQAAARAAARARQVEGARRNALKSADGSRPAPRRQTPLPPASTDGETG